MPVTRAGSVRATIWPDSAPVPQPTSTHVAPAGTLSQARNWSAARRLQRPMNRSYASASCQRSAGIGDPPGGPARCAYWGQARTMIRISVMSSIAQRSPSRPRPESFTPPYGMWSIR